MSCTGRMRLKRLRARSRFFSAARKSVREPKSVQASEQAVMAHTPAPIERTNLLGLTPALLEGFCGELGAQPFRARQLMNWLYKRGVSDFEQMTDLAKDFRGKL